MQKRRSLYIKKARLKLHSDEKAKVAYVIHSNHRANGDFIYHVDKKRSVKAANILSTEKLSHT